MTPLGSAFIFHCTIEKCHVIMVSELTSFASIVFFREVWLALKVEYLICLLTCEMQMHVSDSYLIYTYEFGLKLTWDIGIHAIFFFLLTHSWVICDLCHMGGKSASDTHSIFWAVSQDCTPSPFCSSFSLKMNCDFASNYFWAVPCALLHHPLFLGLQSVCTIEMG